MPLYEYKCLKCEKVHEVMQKFSDAPLIECPDCQGEVTKLMSLSSFALKGSGWYTTDYKRSSSPSSSSPSSASASSSSSSSSGSSGASGSSSSATPAPAAASADTSSKSSGSSSSSSTTSS